MICLLLCAVILISPLTSVAQDIHFSQYLSSPFNLNPALAGDFKGDFRITANYRNQWHTITVPYKTYGLAADMTEIGGLRNFSGGLSFYSDQAGDSKMNTLIVQLPLSYGYPLTTDSAHSLYFGLMPGMVRQQFDYGNLYFDNQYDNQTGLHDPSMASGENTNNAGLTYVNLSTGLRWHFTIAPRHKIDAGFAIFNLIDTKKYYLSDKTSDKRRFNIHANYQIKVWKNIDLLPGLLYTEQGKNKSMIVGSSARYLFNGFTAFHAGLWYRNSDAAFINVGMTYQTLYVGFSYDVNTSKLSNSSDGRGAYELSVIYVIRKFKPNNGKYLSCPNYL
jgi:type IX secretion system PorP/SprF family membrane protein